MNSKGQKPLGLNVGSASIIMVFAVLCLTVFSALSLVTAVSEQSTAQRFARATSEYYDADAEAIEVKASLEEKLDSGESAESAAADCGAVYSASSEGTLFSYAVPMEDGISQLSVVLLYSEGSMENLTWEKTSTSEWTPDTSIQVWDFQAAADEAEAAEK